MNIFSGILNMTLQLLTLFFKFVGVFLIPVFISIGVQFAYLIVIKKMRFKKSEFKKEKIKKDGHLKRLFYLFPRRLALDYLNKNPDEFEDYGVHIIAGEQGAGKTITVAYLLNQYRIKNPGVKIRSNFGYKYEDDKITDWQSLVADNNGYYGQIEVIDELQNWFSSLESKDFPPEMLREITQQRKQWKMILSTSQVFKRCAKPVREQTMFLYEPITFMGAITFVRKSKPVLDNDGDVKKKRSLGIFYFVHDDYLRNSFDTRQQIEYLKKGFKPRSEQLSSFNNNSFNIDKKLLKKKFR